MQEHFYQKTKFKNTVLILLPLISTVLSSVISITTNSIVKTVCMMLIIFLAICTGIFGIIFSNNDEKVLNIIQELNNQIEKSKSDLEELNSILMHMENNYKTCFYTTTTVSELTEKWAKTINSFANNVRRNGQISDKAWDKVKIMDSICDCCKKMIQKYCNDNDDSKVSVGFVYYKEDESGEQWVNMIAHSKPKSNRPIACKGECKLSECKYYYADLIREGETSVKVAENNNEIKSHFNEVNIGNTLNSYTQYIAVPIYCTNNKILGIFQVVTEYGYIIEDNKKDLLSFAIANIIPYSNLILLVDKIYKGLYINPEKINQEE